MVVRYIFEKDDFKISDYDNLLIIANENSMKKRKTAYSLTPKNLRINPNTSHNINNDKL